MKDIHKKNQYAKLWRTVKQAKEEADCIKDSEFRILGNYLSMIMNWIDKQAELSGDIIPLLDPQELLDSNATDDTPSKELSEPEPNMEATQPLHFKFM